MNARAQRMGWITEANPRIDDVALFLSHLCASSADVADEVRQGVTHALATGVLTVPAGLTVEDVVLTVARLTVNNHCRGVLTAGCRAYLGRESRRKASEAEGMGIIPTRGREYPDLR